MIQSNRKVIEAQRDQCITRGRADLGLHHHRSRSQHIDIALIELAKAATRGAVGAPDRLDLIALEKLWQLVLILCDDACERHGQIVTQRQIGLAGLFMLAAFQDLEDELIAFFAVLAHQRFDVFDGGSLQRLETVSLVHGLYDADDVLAFAHVGGQKVAHAARWLCFWGRHLRLARNNNRVSADYADYTDDVMKSVPGA